jgi:NADPH-dependent 2,4-dienoyl-CoA reductase/sulfur reductase-like enzyme
LIASGAETVVPKIVGADQVPQITLRTLADLEKIRSAIKDTTKNITIVGAGFIGIELSSSLKAEYKDKVNVTLLDSQSAPL